MLRGLLTAIVFACSYLQIYANDTDSLINKIANFPDKLFSRVNKKTADLDNQLDKQTEKYLQKLIKREARLKKELYSIDSNGAKYLFLQNPEEQYALLLKKLKTDSSKLAKSTGTDYLPYADSLQGSLAFLNKNPQFIPHVSKVVPADIQNSVDQIQMLQAKMQNAELAKQFIIERREQIKQFIEMHYGLPSSIANIYKDYNKQLYYYTQQLNEYKEILNDPDKMLKTALRLLNKLPAFTAFMQKNSYLSGLFNLPDDYNMQNALPGMQTRDMINQLIQNQISAGGTNAANAFSQGMGSAQAELQGLKEKISSLGGGGENSDLSKNFKPNNQKTKSLFQRLEYGTNLQTTHSNYYFPLTTDLGLSVGYKLNNKSIIGIGASYKIGWGTDISHISVSSQGAGLRSFLDLQIKGGIYASGGYEYNYQPSIYSTNQINQFSNWQESGLLGISKIVAMNTKFFKKTKIQLLWDFLSYNQVPRTQPIKFRIGYNF